LECFNTGQSTVCDINQTKAIFTDGWHGTKNVKTMKVGEQEKLDEALYVHLALPTMQ